MARSIIPILETVKTKLKNILASHPRYTLSTDAIHAQLSIEYTMIPLKKPCKFVDLYYSGDCVFAYKKMIQVYQRCIDNKMLQMKNILDQLDLYVNGWSAGKEITTQNIKTLMTMVQYRQDLVKKLIYAFDELHKEFDRLNTHDDTEMVDHCELALYKMTDQFPYRRAYKHFFKKDSVSDKLVQAHIETDMAVLEQLLSLMSILYTGWNRVGKGEEYETWRIRQRELISIIDTFSSVVEQDIELYERFTQLNETIITFKVYPKEKSSSY